MLFGIFDEFIAGVQIPFAPRRDDFNFRVERVIAKLKPNLVIALTGRAVTDGIRADLMRNLNLTFGNQRPRDGCAEQIKPFVKRIGAKHRKDEIADKFFAQIVDENLFDAGGFGFAARGFQLFALAQIGRESDNFAAFFLLQPFQDDRGVQTAGIGQDDFFG